MAALLAATGMTRMRPDGAGIHVVREWCGIVARHYYALASRAIRSADPDALYFGDRLPSITIRRRAGDFPYLDAIATNYNVDASDGWIADYYFDGLRKLSGGKPVLVSEWFCTPRQNSSDSLNGGHLMTGNTQPGGRRGGGGDRELPAIPKSSAATVPVSWPPHGAGAQRRGLWFRARRHRRPP